MILHIHSFALTCLCLLLLGSRGHASQEGMDLPVSGASFPVVHYESFPISGSSTGSLAFPRNSRLDLTNDEGTLEFWVKPSWRGTGGPRFRCILVNGGSVYRRESPDSNQLTRVFEARYAVYLTRTSVVFQSGDLLHEIHFSEFTGANPLAGSSPTHFSLATKGDSTTVTVEGRASVTLGHSAAYGPKAGTITVLGGMPGDARGRIRLRKNDAKFSTFEAGDPSDFGPFTGQLGGVRIWDRALPANVLVGTQGPAPILFYGQFYAERDLSFEAINRGTFDVNRSSLVAMSTFDHEHETKLRIVDPIGGNWINDQVRQPRRAQVNELLKKFEPITIIQNTYVITFVPRHESGEPPLLYEAYANGELAGSLALGTGGEASPFTFETLAGQSYPVSQVPGEDRMTIHGSIPAFGPAAGNRVDLIRCTGRSKGTSAPASDVFLASMRATDIEFSLKSYDMLTMHPVLWRRGGQELTGSDQWIFQKMRSEDWQLAFGNNIVLPMGFYLDAHHESGGTTTGVTTTTERETYEALRAKWGIQGGTAGNAATRETGSGVTVGHEGQYSESEHMRTLTTSVSSLGQTWAKLATIMLDPMYVEFSEDFKRAIVELEKGRDYAHFIEKWGTHYPRGVTQGGVIYSERTLDQSETARTSEWGLDISSFFQVGGSQDPTFRAEGGGGITKRETAKTMLEFSESAWTAEGAAVITTNSEMVMSELSLDSALPVSLDLRLISDLLSPAYFEDPIIYGPLRREFREELLAYLEGKPLSDEPAIQVPPIRKSVTLHAKVAKFNHNCPDGNGAEGEFWGKILVSAYADYDQKETYAPENRQEYPTTLWNTSSKNQWKVDKQTWVDFNAAPGAAQAFQDKGHRQPFFTKQGEVEYGPIDVTQVLLENMALEFNFELTEEDTKPDKDEQFHPLAVRFQEKDFRREDGEYGTKDWPVERDVTLHGNGNSGTATFKLELWMDVEEETWRNQSASALKELRRQLVVNSPDKPHAPVLGPPTAYWPFDTKRPFTTGMQPYAGDVGRVLDDGLVLTPVADQLLVPPPGQRGFTLQFDARLTESTRRLEIRDETGLVRASVLLDSPSGFTVQMGNDSIALQSDGDGSPNGFTPTPYVWHRYWLSFDGKVMKIAVDDGLGSIQVNMGRASEPTRGSYFANKLSNSGNQEEPVAWLLSSDYSPDYHSRHRRSAGSDGYLPGSDSELTLIDEVRFWNEAIDGRHRSLLARIPRRFESPSEGERPFVYHSIAKPDEALAGNEESLLEALISTESRGRYASPIADLPASVVVQAGGLLLSVEDEASFITENLKVSDFTLHMDFVPGNGLLEIHRGPIRFTCNDGRPLLSIKTGEESSFDYDPAFGDRIARDQWHKLVFAVDAGESRLHVLLDGESLGATALTQAVVDSLLAGDQEPGQWHMRHRASGTDKKSTAPLVDEIIVLGSALSSQELERLSRRLREPGGDAPPSRLRSARTLPSLDLAASDLRPGDEVLAEDVIAYFPLEASLKERSGRGNPSMAPETGTTHLPAFEDGALLATTPVEAELPDLDLEQYTLALWFSPRSGNATLLSAPGLELRIDGFGVPGVYSLYLDHESIDGRRATAGLGFVSSQREGQSMSKSLLNHFMDPSREPVERQFLERIQDTGISRAHPWESWHSLVLLVDVEAGEIRGAWNGRALIPMRIPPSFSLRSRKGSVPRVIRAHGPEEDAIAGRIDELIVLNGTPSPSSPSFQHLLTRPREQGLPIDWIAEEGSFFAAGSPETHVVPRSFDECLAAEELDWLPDFPGLPTPIADRLLAYFPFDQDLADIMGRARLVGLEYRSQGGGAFDTIIEAACELDDLKARALRTRGSALEERPSFHVPLAPNGASVCFAFRLRSSAGPIVRRNGNARLPNTVRLPKELRDSLGAAWHTIAISNDQAAIDGELVEIYGALTGVQPEGTDGRNPDYDVFVIGSAVEAVDEFMVFDGPLDVVELKTLSTRLRMGPSEASIFSSNRSPEALAGILGDALEAYIEAVDAIRGPAEAEARSSQIEASGIPEPTMTEDYRRQLLETLDFDKDGALTKADLEQLRSVDPEDEPQEAVLKRHRAAGLERVLAGFDVDLDGRVTGDDLGLEGEQVGSTEWALLDADFVQYKDHSGYAETTRDLVADAQRRLGAARQVLLEAMESADNNGDGLVDPDETGWIATIIPDFKPSDAPRFQEGVRLLFARLGLPESESTAWAMAPLRANADPADTARRRLDELRAAPGEARSSRSPEDDTQAGESAPLDASTTDDAI